MVTFLWELVVIIFNASCRFCASERGGYVQALSNHPSPNHPYLTHFSPQTSHVDLPGAIPVYFGAAIRRHIRHFQGEGENEADQL